jgi:hypothetical protein
MKRPFVIASLLTFVLCLLAGTALAQTHEDKKLGFKVRYPRGWEVIPIKSTERWIVAKFLCDREYTDHSEEWASSYRPEMQVILFPDAVTKDRGVSEEKIETEDGSDITFRELKNPYRDYEDYLDKTLSGGGWHISVKEEKKEKDLEWTLIEVKIDKLTYGGKKRLVAGVFHAPDADYVVQVIVLEASYKKLRNTIYGCLSTFEFIPREGNIARATSGTIKLTDEWKMTPRERKKHREEIQERGYQRAVEALPRGWDHFEFKGIYVISHVDRKDAMEFAAQAAALRAWLEKTFDFLGDEYARSPIIRVCASGDEANSYGGGSGSGILVFFSGSRYTEIVTYIDKSDVFIGDPMSSMNRRIVSDWFSDKDEYVGGWNLPSWLDYGIDTYVEGATLKGSRLVFKQDMWDRQDLKLAKAKGEMHSIRQLLTVAGDEKKSHTYEQYGAFLRFLLEGPGKRMKVGKTLIEDYLTVLRKQLIEEEEEWKKKAAEATPEEEKEMTEEEEEEAEAERMKKRAEDWKSREKETLKELFERAFGDVKESDWDNLERAYRSWLR